MFKTVFWFESYNIPRKTLIIEAEKDVYFSTPQEGLLVATSSTRDNIDGFVKLCFRFTSYKSNKFYLVDTTSSEFSVPKNTRHLVYIFRGGSDFPINIIEFNLKESIMDTQLYKSPVELIPDYITNPVVMNLNLKS